MFERNGLVLVAMDDENLGVNIGNIVDRGNFIEIQPETKAHVSEEGSCNERWHPPLLEFEVHHLDRMGDRTDCDDAFDPLISAGGIDGRAAAGRESDYADSVGGGLAAFGDKIYRCQGVFRKSAHSRAFDGRTAAVVAGIKCQQVCNPSDALFE